jgi:hypothetical protein
MFLRQPKLTYESAAKDAAGWMKSGSSLSARKPFPTRSLLMGENAASADSLQAQTIKDIRLGDQP